MTIAFKPIQQSVLQRFESVQDLDELMPDTRSVAELELISDDRYLSAMCLRVFRAGMNHGVVDSKWRNFDTVYHGFKPEKLADLSDEQLESLMSHEGLIAHWGKVKSIRANAQFVQDIASRYGSFGHWVATWPAEDIVGLWNEIRRMGSQLGGKSAPYFLRYVGKDTFILTDDVAAALEELGVCSGNPETKANLALIQRQMNLWRDETGLPLSHISKILAMTVNQHVAM